MSCYGISIATPTVETVTTAQLKNWLRITHSSDDDELALLATMARERVEAMSRRVLVNSVVTQTHGGFPHGDCIALERDPVSTFTSIAYEDVNGDSQTFSSSLYRFVSDKSKPFVRLIDGSSWPATETSNDAAVTLTYTAGYGEAATDVPASLQMAVRIAAVSAYENRGDGQGSVDLDLIRATLDNSIGPEMRF